MAKHKPEKKRAKDASDRPQLPGTREASPSASTTAPPTATRILPMQLQVGDRISDETGEWEVVNRPHTMAGAKSAHVRVHAWISRRSPRSARGVLTGASR